MRKVIFKILYLINIISYTEYKFIVNDVKEGKPKGFEMNKINSELIKQLLCEYIDTIKTDKICAVWQQYICNYPLVLYDNVEIIDNDLIRVYGNNTETRIVIDGIYDFIGNKLKQRLDNENTDEFVYNKVFDSFPKSFKQSISRRDILNSLDV